MDNRRFQNSANSGTLLFHSFRIPRQLEVFVACCVVRFVLTALGVPDTSKLQRVKENREKTEERSGNQITVNSGEGSSKSDYTSRVHEHGEEIEIWRRQLRRQRRGGGGIIPYALRYGSRCTLLPAAQRSVRVRRPHIEVSWFVIRFGEERPYRRREIRRSAAFCFSQNMNRICPRHPTATATGLWLDRGRASPPEEDSCSAQKLECL